MSKRQRKHRNDLGSLFAASFTVVLGAGIACAMFAVGTRDTSSWFIVLIICSAAMMLAAIIGIRWPNVRTGLAFWHTTFRTRAKTDRSVDYQPCPIDRERMGTPGRQKPITADEVREIRLLSGNTWVPSRSRRKHDDNFLE
ncbi:MAG: hypothetical protein MK102_16040 [Fuerstiella sp.]|nr:hypothetical protein [Fuerstiella sp.]